MMKINNNWLRWGKKATRTRQKKDEKRREAKKKNTSETYYFHFTKLIMTMVIKHLFLKACAMTSLGWGMGAATTAPLNELQIAGRIRITTNGNNMASGANNIAWSPVARDDAMQCERRAKQHTVNTTRMIRRGICILFT